MAASTDTFLVIENLTQFDMHISVSEMDEGDWEWVANDKADSHFQNMIIYAFSSMSVREDARQREEPWYKMTILFSNGDVVTLRNDFAMEHTDVIRDYNLGGKSAGKYVARKLVSDGMTTYTITSRE